MSITNELRAWAKEHLSRSIILAIADRIDAEHERGIADAELAVAPTESQLAELGWAKLPMDADGVPIRFGDKVTVSWSEKVYEVSGFSYTQQLAGGERTIWVDVYSLEKMGNIPLCGANSCHHYHAPTVEDVLREFGDWYAHTKGGCDEDGVIAEYAAKLRLANDGKER